MLLLGIETSCDDTATAVVRDGVHVLANVSTNQDEFHAKYGGIVPESARRRHAALPSPAGHAAPPRAPGGASQVVEGASPTALRILARTRDDAAGEAFDKTARLLDLPFPGGP